VVFGAGHALDATTEATADTGFHSSGVIGRRGHTLM
jgi:hypothetical protein